MTTIYVNTAAPPAGDGTSWATAYQTLQPALVDAGTTPGSQIWIATGSYFPGGLSTDTFTVPDQTSIYGGFAGTEAALGDRAPAPANPVYLDGTNVNDVVMTTDFSSTVLLNRLNFKQTARWLLDCASSSITITESNFTDVSIGSRAIRFTFAGATFFFDNLVFKDLVLTGNAFVLTLPNNCTGTLQNSVFRDITVSRAVIFGTPGSVNYTNVEIFNCNVTTFGIVVHNFTGPAATVNVTDCKIHDTVSVNSALSFIEIPDNLNITNTELYNNTAAAAPINVASFNFGGQSTTPVCVIDSCNIHDNTTSDSGSGVFLYGAGSSSTVSFTIKNTEVANNKVNGNITPDDSANVPGSAGGGVYLYHDIFGTDTFNVVIDNCNVHDNFSSFYGGGLAYNGINNQANTVVVTNSKFNNNSCDVAGGGFYLKKGPFRNANLTITDSEINDNYSQGDGAGMEIDSIFNPFQPNQVTIQNTDINNNVAEGLGGAIHIYNSDPSTFALATTLLTLDTVTVTNNKSNSTSGGAVAIRNYNALVTNSELSNNKCQDSGGAWFAQENNDVDFITVTFDKNKSGVNGGAVSIEATGSEVSTFQMDTVTLSKNNAQGGYGGGVFASGSQVTGSFDNSQLKQNKAVSGGAVATNFSTVQINDSEVFQNTASAFGGGLYAANAAFTVQNDHIHNNASTLKGGAMAAVNCTLSLTDSHIHNNSGQNPGGVYIQAGTSTVTNNNVHNNTNFEIGWSSTAIIGGQNTAPTIKTYLTSNNTVSAADIGQV